MNMAVNLEEILNPKQLETGGRALWEAVFVRRPFAMPVVLALLCAAVAWNALSSPVNLGSSSRDRDRDRDKNAAKAEVSKPELNLSRDLFSPPPSYSYSLQGVYSMDGEDIAIINGGDHRVGSQVGKAKVVEITAEVVRIQEEGKDTPTELRVFGRGESSEGGGRGGRGGWSPGGGAPPGMPAMPSRDRPSRRLPAASPSPAPAGAAPSDVVSPAKAEWDWSSWPGPPETQAHLEELKKAMSDPAQRAQAKAGWDMMKSSGMRPPEITDAMVEWIDRCFAHFESNG